MQLGKSLGSAVLVVALAGAIASCSAPPPDGPSPQTPSSSSPEAPGSLFQGLTLTEPVARPTFTLLDERGAPYEFAGRTAGTPTLLFFGYTSCPDICPTTMADVAVALRDLPAEIADQMQVVFVTTDPVVDTAPVLRDYLDHFDGDLPRRFIGLTGTQEQIDAAQHAARIPVATDGGATHSTLLQLYGPDDVSRVMYAAGFTPGNLVHDIPLVLG